MTLQEAFDYYTNTLITQYRDKSKAIQTIECLVNCAFCDGLPLQFNEAFDLDTAAGEQLTLLGRIVGVPRNIYGLDLTHEFFNFTRYSGTPASNGFNRWTTVADSYLISRWRTNATYVTTDFELRALINLKIIYNNSYKSLGVVKESLYNVFGGLIDIVDNVDFTLTYNFYSPYHNVGTICNYLSTILPKPMGVSVSIVNL